MVTTSDLRARARTLRRGATGWALAALLALTALTAVLAGCGGGGEDDNGWVCVGACPSRGFIAVEDSSSARTLAAAIGETVADVVPTGAYSNTLVNGLSGTARVTGTKTYSGSVSCGTDCVSSTNSANLTIVFSDYLGRPGNSTNTRVRLTGTVTFTDTRSTRQQGLSYSSSGNMHVTATGLAARFEITENGVTYGYSDTLATLNASSSSGSSWSGTLRGTNGVTYNF